MAKGRLLFTSESVTEGHPDKIADQISDAILDAVIEADATSRVAVETMVTTGLVVVAGEMTTRATPDVSHIVRETVRQVGYTRAKYGFDCDTCGVLTAIDKQSPDIAMGVDTGGAGDQGMMFGYACHETAELMPMPIQLAHRLSQRLSEARRDGTLPWLRPDGKSQVTVEYEDGRPLRVDAVVVSTQHAPEVSTETIRKEIDEKIIRKVVPEVIDLVGLEGKRDRMPDELSGGEQQRVAMARAFVNRPMILLADEPTGNIDPATSIGIMKVLDRINRTGTTVVMATHDAAIVDSMRKRVIELEYGKVVRDQSRGVYGQAY